jgi:uncharacterized membrane protein
MDEIASLGNPWLWPEVRAVGAWVPPLRSRMQLAAKAIRHPCPAALHLALRARLARLDAGAEHTRLLDSLTDDYGVEGQALGAEYLDSSFRRACHVRRNDLHRRIGPRRLGISNSWCLRALYLLVRAVRPATVALEATGAQVTAAPGVATVRPPNADQLQPR